MARITASLYTSHIPAVGAAFDLGKTKENYWKPVFAGYDFDKEWVKTHKPDVIFLVYTDHATAFSLQMIPTFAIMTGPEFYPADEGYGARPVPKVIGDPELASYIASEVIQQDFDLTMVNEIDVDHGLTVPLSCVFGEVDAWPCKVIPFAVNVVQHPVPSGARCFALGSPRLPRLAKQGAESASERNRCEPSLMLNARASLGAPRPRRSRCAARARA